jgi:hypothetical protein
VPTLVHPGLPTCRLVTDHVADLMGFVNAATVVTVAVPRATFGLRGDIQRFEGAKLYAGSLDSEQQPLHYRLRPLPRQAGLPHKSLALAFDSEAGTLTYLYHPDRPAKMQRYLWSPAQQPGDSRSHPSEVTNCGTGHFVTHLGATGSLFVGPVPRKVYYVGKTNGDHPQVVVVTIPESYDDMPAYHAEFFVGSLAEGVAHRRPVTGSFTVPLGFRDEFTLEIRGHHFVSARSTRTGANRPALWDGHALTAFPKHHVLHIDEATGQAQVMGR